MASFMGSPILPLVSTPVLAASTVGPGVAMGGFRIWRLSPVSAQRLPRNKHQAGRLSLGCRTERLGRFDGRSGLPSPPGIVNLEITTSSYRCLFFHLRSVAPEPSGCPGRCAQNQASVTAATPGTCSFPQMVSRAGKEGGRLGSKKVRGQDGGERSEWR